MTENPGLTEVKRVVDRLEDDVREIKSAIRGNDFGERGLISRVDAVKREQDDLKKIVDGFAKAEKQREDARLAREKRRDGFQKWVFGLLAAIIVAVVSNLILLYINGVIG